MTKELIELAKEQRTTGLKPTACKKCGGTRLIYGRKDGFCLNCRNKIRRPYKGWVDAEGNLLHFHVVQCKTCGRTFEKERRPDLVGNHTRADDESKPCQKPNLADVGEW